jgi:NADPH:quinone reductase-like Zn-dependent oxidoreductase
MRALGFHQTGSVDNLIIEELPTPGEVLVQVKAAAVNPSKAAKRLDIIAQS